jgi:hypothetical protein
MELISMSDDAIEKIFKKAQFAHFIRTVADLDGNPTTWDNYKAAAQQIRQYIETEIIGEDEIIPDKYIGLSPEETINALTRDEFRATQRAKLREPME